MPAMHRVLTGILVGVLPFLAVAQDLEGELGDELDDGFMDEFALLEDAAVVESAARHKQEIGMSPSAITVITREDIEATGATSIGDLLRLVPGMEVTVNSQFFISLASRIFWTNENLFYLVLVDGREANMELLGQAPTECQPISLEDVERIEVIRGPGSSLYGANALAGVVSITTRAVPEKTSVWARVGAGEAGTLVADARASTRIGPWGFSISGGVDLAGTFADPSISAEKVYKFRAYAEHRFSEKNKLLADFGMSRGRGPVSSAAGMVDGILALRTLRLAYESENLRGQLYWLQSPSYAKLNAPLEFNGIRLAKFLPAWFDNHTIDAEVQWRLPVFWDPLLVIAGARGRASYLGSDDMLDAETYADITSSRYHEPGVSYWQFRTGAFVHAEFTPADWVTVTAGLRVDYNTFSGAFLSPRGAAVFQPQPGQYLRMGVARSFRKPSFLETHGHPMVEFLDDSPITGTGRDKFLEFVTRMVGNLDLRNEELLSFEAGYLGQYLDNRLQVSLDLYYNRYYYETATSPNIVEDEQRLPDLDLSSFMFENSDESDVIFGGELSVRFSVTKNIMIQAAWSHREVYHPYSKLTSDEAPKNLLTLGGRFKTDSGLVGSLYGFSRSAFWDRSVENPGGLLEPMLEQYLDNCILVLSKLGWRWKSGMGVDLEAGTKLFLPVSFSAPNFSYYEKGGKILPDGRNFGGEQLRRMVTVYLQGSF
jgi:hypothetical protein